MKVRIGILLVVVGLIASTAGYSGDWYLGIVHSHTIFSDGGKKPSELALTIQSKLSFLRQDGKCFWINTDHFDAMTPEKAKAYPDAIRSTSEVGKFIAIPCLEVGSKWHPEPDSVADANMLAIGILPPDYYQRLLDCYDKNPGKGLPLVEKFDFQQELINRILALGMLPVAAHPTQLVIGGAVLRTDMRFNMKSGFDGLCGVEMFNTFGPGQDDECVNFYLRLIASGLPVFVAAGSDYHGSSLSAIPDALLDPLNRITWVYADEFSPEAITRAISEGKTCATCADVQFNDFLSSEGQNPGFAPVGVDEVLIVAEARLTGSDVNFIVYRDGVEVARQEYKGSLLRSYYTLNGDKATKSGWTDKDVTPNEVHRYVVRVMATTKTGRQTVLITSPITLRLRPAGQTAAFFDAIKAGNLPAMTSALAADPSLANSRDNRDYNLPVHKSKPLALSVACALGSADSVKCLLEHGAKPDDYLGAGEPGPLMEVAYNGDVEKARLMIAYGANPSICTDGNTPLAWAISGRHVELCTLLIKAGADLTRVDDNGQKPLTIAKRYNLTEIIDLLIAKGANE